VAISDKALTANEIADLNKSIKLSVSSNLVAYWHMNEGIGSLLADSSNNTNTGTIVGATWSVDDIGKGFGTAESPILIRNLSELAWLSNSPNEWDKYYKQIEDIDASPTQYWDDTDDNSDGDKYNDVNDFTIDGSNEGFKPIGFGWYDAFTGNYDGNNKIINNLTINRPLENYIGLFGSRSGSLAVMNLGLTNVNIYGGLETGSLSGYTESGLTSNCFSTGTVRGKGNQSSGMGGLGGLIASLHGSKIQNSYSTASVSGDGSRIGGLVGYMAIKAIVENSYSIGSVSGGGLIGYINQSDITGNTKVSIINSFWDTETSGTSSSADGIGKTTDEMKTDSTYFNAGWDFEAETVNGRNNYWDMDNISKSYNDGYPFLSWQSDITYFLEIETESIPTEFALHENYPNPFNPTTTLRFDLPEVSDITLTIYNMLGQKVRTFNYQNTSAGYHSVTWDATNDYGEQVGAGVYLYQLQTKDFVKTRKMVLLK
jgi:hypothetical protein